MIEPYLRYLAMPGLKTAPGTGLLLRVYWRWLEGPATSQCAGTCGMPLLGWTLSASMLISYMNHRRDVWTAIDLSVP